MVDQWEILLMRGRDKMIWFVRDKIYLSGGGGICCCGKCQKPGDISASAPPLELSPSKCFRRPARYERDNGTIPRWHIGGYCGDERRRARVPTRPSTRLMSSCNGCTMVTSLLPRSPRLSCLRKLLLRQDQVGQQQLSGDGILDPVACSRATGRRMKDLSLLPCTFVDLKRSVLFTHVTTIVVPKGFYREFISHETFDYVGIAIPLQLRSFMRYRRKSNSILFAFTVQTLVFISETVRGRMDDGTLSNLRWTRGLSRKT